MKKTMHFMIFFISTNLGAMAPEITHDFSKPNQKSVVIQTLDGQKFNISMDLANKIGIIKNFMHTTLKKEDQKEIVLKVESPELESLLKLLQIPQESFTYYNYNAPSIAEASALLRTANYLEIESLIPKLVQAVGSRLYEIIYEHKLTIYALNQFVKEYSDLRPLLVPIFAQASKKLSLAAGLTNYMPFTTKKDILINILGEQQYSQLIHLLRTMHHKDQLNEQLETAVMNNEYESVVQLVNTGADVNFRNSGKYYAYGYGTSLLSIAAQNGDTRICTFLLDHGASVDSTGPGKETPLTTAVIYSKSKNIIPLLISYGADVSHKNSEGHTAVMLADAKWKLIQLLTTITPIQEEKILASKPLIAEPVAESEIFNGVVQDQMKYILQLITLKDKAGNTAYDILIEESKDAKGPQKQKNIQLAAELVDPNNSKSQAELETIVKNNILTILYGAPKPTPTQEKQSAQEQERIAAIREIEDLINQMPDQEREQLYEELGGFKGEPLSLEELEQAINQETNEELREELQDIYDRTYCRQEEDYE